MAEAPEPAASGAPRVFISYSRADRQRVTGLFELLQALDHRVFMDERSIRAGRRWRPELEKELHAADVLVVFWTRHARDSKWVRREYVDFDTRFPERPIVPIRGDKSELTHRLAVHQHTDFCPIINELLDMVRDLEDKKISTIRVSAQVDYRLRRLDEEESVSDRCSTSLPLSSPGAIRWRAKKERRASEPRTHIPFQSKSTKPPVKLAKMKT